MRKNKTINKTLAKKLLIKLKHKNMIVFYFNRLYNYAKVFLIVFHYMQCIYMYDFFFSFCAFVIFSLVVKQTKCSNQQTAFPLNVLYMKCLCTGPTPCTYPFLTMHILGVNDHLFLLCVDTSHLLVPYMNVNCMKQFVFSE